VSGSGGDFDEESEKRLVLGFRVWTKLI
jgi:hypothetical protein